QVKLPDIPGMASQLGSIAATIDTLPFIKNIRALDSMEKPELPTETDTSFSFISRVVKDIANGLFTIQRTNEPVEPLLPPQEKQFLKHNLNLKIEEARIALLNQETALFQKNLTAVEDWTKKYFNDQDPSVATMLQSVSELKQVELQPSLPDISHSLRDLRAWMSQQKQAAIDTKKVDAIVSTRVSTLASTKHDNSAGLLP
ncbi:uroporphyrinogen-III C-methyltransferase, partial [Kaarinaea lacus]